MLSMPPSEYFDLPYSDRIYLETALREREKEKKRELKKKR